MKIQTLAFVVALLFSANSQSAGPAADALSLYRFSRVARPQLDLISERFEIIARNGEVFEALVPPAKASDFLKLAPKARLLVLDIHDALRQNENTWGPAFHDFASVKTDLAELAKNHSDLVRLVPYGKSENGQELLALKITDNPDTDEKEPQLLLTAATHGNEIMTTEVVFGLISTLLDGYGKDSRITKMVDGLELYFIPVVNPDGYARRSRYANGVDPNREYPVPGEPLPAKDANACIQNLITFFAKHDIKGSIDFHTHGEVILYPWGYTETEMPSSSLRTFEDLTALMTKSNKYKHGQISHMLYKAKGNSADYYFDKNRTIALGIEVGRSHSPSPSAIPAAVKSQTESTWVFLEHFL